MTTRPRIALVVLVVVGPALVVGAEKSKVSDDLRNTAAIAKACLKGNLLRCVLEALTSSTPLGDPNKIRDLNREQAEGCNRFLEKVVPTWQGHATKLLEEQQDIKARQANYPREKRQVEAEQSHLAKRRQKVADQARRLADRRKDLTDAMGKAEQDDRSWMAIQKEAQTLVKEQAALAELVAGAADPPSRPNLARLQDLEKALEAALARHGRGLKFGAARAARLAGEFGRAAVEWAVEVQTWATAHTRHAAAAKVHDEAGKKLAAQQRRWEEHRTAVVGVYSSIKFCVQTLDRCDKEMRTTYGRKWAEPAARLEDRVNRLR